MKGFMMKGLTVLFFLLAGTLCYSQEWNRSSVLLLNELVPQEDFQLSNLADDTIELDSLETSAKLSTAHKVFGYATVLTGLATGIFNPGLASEEVHSAMGIATAGLSAVTLGLGYAAHRNDVSVKDGLSSNLVHAALGIAGGAMMLVTPFLAPSDAHAALGMAGVATMGLSIVTKWVY